MSTAKALGVKASALPAWQRLQVALRDADTPVPCTQDPDMWTEPPNTMLADYCSQLCIRTCPVLAQCNTFAQANKETSGIWAGLNRSPVDRRRTTTEQKEPA